MLHSKNRLLACLGVSDIDRFRPYLTVTELHHGEVLADTHQSVNKVYFPHEGIISCIVDLKNGEGIETGMIGADGAFGAMQALDDKVSLNRVVIQFLVRLRSSKEAGLEKQMMPFPSSGRFSSNTSSCSWRRSNKHSVV